MWRCRYLVSKIILTITKNATFATKLRMFAAQTFNKLYYHILVDYAIEAEQLDHVVYVRRQGFLGAMPQDRQRIVHGLSQQIVEQQHILE